MKKILLLIAMCLLAWSVDAQFVLTPEGFRDKNGDADYITINFPNKSQSELYNDALTFVTTLYVSPKDVLSKIDNEVITINGIQKDGVYGKNSMGIKTPFTINYTIVLRFKDGKMRIDSPNIAKMYNESVEMKVSGSNAGSMNGNIVVFKKNGDVRKKEAKESIEYFFNGYIKKLTDNINNEKNNNW